MGWLEDELARPLPEHLPTLEESFLPVAQGEIRILHHRPAHPETLRPVIVAPGFGATLLGWGDTYRVLGERAEFWVIETLEKGSTHLNTRKPRLSPPELARQIAAGVAHIGAEDYVLLGGSWGATVLLEGLIQGSLAPPTAISFDPVDELWFPKWFLRVGRPLLPVFVLSMIRKPLAAIILRPMTQPHQRARVDSFVKAADPLRWKAAGTQAVDFRLSGRLGKIQREVFIAGGSHDALHTREGPPALVREIPRGRMISCVVDERDRERLGGAIALAFAKVRGADSLPPVLEAYTT